MSLRIEQKYKMTLSDQKIFKTSLIKKGAKEIYSPREINSCYFDTKYLDCFHESEEGFLPRKKIRIRWYGDSTTYQKELKISSIEGRFKTIDKFPSKDFFLDKNMKLFDANIGLLRSTLLVKYWREYYIFNELRITFDSKIKYIDLRGSNRRSFSDFECVCEVKTDQILFEDKINKLINMPTSRFSKYCRGISLVNDY